MPSALSVVALLVLIGLAVALLGARTTTPRTAAAPIADPITVAAVDPPLPLDAAASDPPAEAAPSAEFVRIANTDRLGAFIRSEPRANAPPVGRANRDGTVLKIVGPDTSVAGQVWRQVQDPQGNRGWTSQQYLVPTDEQF